MKTLKTIEKICKATVLETRGYVERKGVLPSNSWFYGRMIQNYKEAAKTMSKTPQTAYDEISRAINYSSGRAFSNDYFDHCIAGQNKTPVLKKIAEGKKTATNTKISQALPYLHQKF